jgi:Putative transmembrane protein (PGPGW)
MQKTETAEVPMTPRRAALVALGWILVLCGIVGLPLPVVPGAVLLIAGVAVLRSHSAWLGRALDKWRARFPVGNRFLGWVGMGRSRFRCNPDSLASQFRA